MLYQLLSHRTATHVRVIEVGLHRSPRLGTHRQRDLAAQSSALHVHQMGTSLFDDRYCLFCRVPSGASKSACGPHNDSVVWRIGNVQERHRNGNVLALVDCIHTHNWLDCCSCCWGQIHEQRRRRHDVASVRCDKRVCHVVERISHGVDPH